MKIKLQFGGSNASEIITYQSKHALAYSHLCICAVKNNGLFKHTFCAHIHTWFVNACTIFNIVYVDIAIRKSKHYQILNYQRRDRGNWANRKFCWPKLRGNLIAHNVCCFKANTNIQMQLLMRLHIPDLVWRVHIT